MSYDFRIKPENKFYSYRDFNNIDYNLLYDNFFQIDWNNIYYLISVDDKLDFLESNLLQLYEDTVPLKTKSTLVKTKSWFTTNIKQLIHQRDIAYSRWKRFKTLELKHEYSTARKCVNREIKLAKSEYYSKEFGTALQSKKTWKTIRDIGIGKAANNDCCLTDVNELNSAFTNLPLVQADSDFYNFDNAIDNSTEYEHCFEFSCVNQLDVLSCFSSVKSNAIGYDNIHPKFFRILLPLLLPHVTHIFNFIIMSSIFPSKWKHAKVIPIPKSNEEYRPIAILCYLSKVLEKLLYSQISEFIHEHGLMCDMQSGFRSNHSCITALVEVSENIRRELDDNKLNFLVLLDHSKAFDTVNHRTLCMKLRHFFNFSSSSTQLLSSYLVNRTQSVCVNNLFSEPLTLTRGVPQGSILGPLLFSLYANDLPQQLSHCKVHMYADDVQLYLSSPVKSIKENIDKLNDDLSKIHRWATANGLCLNPNKSKCLVIHKKTINPVIEHEILIDNQKILIVPTAKNLGIVFNSTLTWTNHINSLVGQTYAKLRSLWSTQSFTPLKVRLLLAKTYVLPSLLYGCELFANCDTTSKRRLKVVFNNIVRYVYGLRRFSHVSAFSSNIYGVSFDNFLRIRVLLFLHKTIYTQKPKYLYEKIRFARSNRGKKLILPRHRMLVSEYQFFVNSVRLWNLLPQNLQTTRNATHFKKQLFTFFE